MTLRTLPLWVLSLILALLMVLNGIIYTRILTPEPRVLAVSFLDVGQGDAILVEGPTGIDMLIDGGRDRSVLRELPKELGFFDRSLDIMVATHPDSDHINGLADVLARYQVSYFLESGVENDTAPTARLADAIARERGMGTFTARRGQRIHLGDGAYADILFPDTDVSDVETNEGSIAMRIVYGETSFMLTGDLSSPGENHLVLLEGENLESDVLKAGHHGSRHSSDAVWLEHVSPEYVVISAGEGNSYGHPHEEVLERVRSQSASILSTIDQGTITFTTDGTALTIEE